VAVACCSAWALAWPVQAAPRVGRAPVDLKAAFVRSYRDVWEGAQRDQATHRQMAVEKKAEAAALRKRSAPAAAIAEAEQWALLAEGLADRLQVITTGLQAGHAGPDVMQAMTELVEWEDKLTRLAAGRRQERRWLTIPEAVQLRQRGWLPRAREPGVLPMLRSDWRPQGRVSP
jgi:hypothetical protein